jgi:integrase
VWPVITRQGSDVVASIEKRSRNGQLRWYARFRDPSGAQLVKVFDRKVDAERFLTTVEAAKLTGHYIDAKAGLDRVRAFAEDVTAVLGATPDHYRPLVSLIGLALRISEACGLRVEDVDFSAAPIDDELTGRAAMAVTMHTIIPDVYPMCTASLGESRKPS